MMFFRKHYLLLMLGLMAATGQYALAKPADINITGLGVSIPDGDITPGTADDTDFGTVGVGSWVEHTFTIINDANNADPLSLNGSPTVQLAGDGDFSVTAQPGLTTLNANESTTFTVRFTPSGSGTKTATVTVPNDDTNESPYNFDIQGSVAVAANPPTVASPPTTASIQDITATLGGEVTDTGGANITERGIYWSTISGFTPPGQGFKVSSTGDWATPAPFSEAVTGLPESSIVYFESFAVNSEGTVYSDQASFQTEPTVQASGVSFSGVGAYQMQVDWSGSGSGDGVIVVMKQGSVVDADPQDGTEHTASVQFGSGDQLGTGNYVVFRGSGSSVVVTNLLSDVTYHVAVYAYAGAGPGDAGINYQQDLPAESSQKTLLITAPPSVGNPTASNIQDTTATLGGEVTAINNATVTERGVFWSTTDGFSPPAEGFKLSSSGSWAIPEPFSENVTGLSASDIIYYRAFAVNAEGTNYTAQASFQTEPATQASEASISGIGSSQMQVDWTGSGSGDGVIVVMKQGSAVDADPADGTEHAADAHFGSGDQLGTGNYVVFRGSGSSVLVSNLQSDVTYHAAVYAYAGSGTGTAGINYQQDGPATAFATTLPSAGEPTVVNFPALAVDTTTATLRGNVTAINSANVTERGIYWSTTDGFTPPAQGTKVSSTGNWGIGLFSENITGLNQGSLVYYRAFAVNTIGEGYAPQTAVRMEPSTQASAPSFSSTTDTQTTLQWTSGNGDGTLVLIRAGAPPTIAPVDGTEHPADPGMGTPGTYSPNQIGTTGNYVVYRGAGNSVTITNLLPNATYTIALYEYAGTGSGDGGINYQQDAPPTASVKTLIGQSWMAHNTRYNIGCVVCHGGGHNGDFIAHDEEQSSTTCGQCHNPTGVASNKFEVSLHYNSSSNVVADCGDCHEVHAGSAINNLITFNAHSGLTQTNLFYFRAETNRHPQAIGPGVFHSTGATSEDYAFTNAPPYNGACQVCHTTTSHHTNTGLDVGHGNGSACTDCHSHNEGFKGAGGTDCTACHANAAGSHRAVIPDFGLTYGHIGASVTTNDCMTCHHEEYGNAYHGNTTTDLRNVDDDSVVSIAQPFSRNTASKTLEADVVNLQNNFCLRCHDANGANGDTTPFSNGATVPNIDSALDTGNAYFHPVKGPGNNPKCNSTAMYPPWNQTTTTGPNGDGHDIISCFDCHGINAHGSANNNMLRVHISGPTDGANISVFCTTCHDRTVPTGSYHSNGDHDNPLHTEEYVRNGPITGPFACRGCHSGQQEPDENGDRITSITLESAALDIHGGNYVWPAGTGKTGAGTTTDRFINGGWLEGWASGACVPDGNCQHSTQGYSP